MSAIVLDRRRHAATYVVLVALGLFYAVSLAIFVRADRRASTVLRIDAQPPVPIVLSSRCRSTVTGVGHADARAGPRRSGLDLDDRRHRDVDLRAARRAGTRCAGADARLFRHRCRDPFSRATCDARCASRSAAELVGEVQFLPTDPMNHAFFTGAHFVHSFRVPGRLMMAAPIVLIELHMAPVGPPRMHSWSTDRRQLGVAVRSVTVRIAQ